MEEVGEELLTRGVDADGGFVEDEDFGFAHERAGDKGALELAAGELGDGALCKGRGADEFEDMGDAVASEYRHGAPRRDAPGRREFDHVAHGDGHRQFERGALGKIADEPGGAGGGGGGAEDFYAAGVVGEKSQEDFEEGAFAAAVRTEDAQALAGGDAEVDGLEGGRVGAGIGKADAFADDRGGGRW